MPTPFSTFDPGGCGCPTGIPCEPCNIPANNLTLSWTNTGATGIPATGTVTLTYNATTIGWAYGYFYVGTATRFSFGIKCIGTVPTGGTELEVARDDYIFDGTSDFFWDSTYYETNASPSSFTCSPYHLGYTVPGPGAGSALYADGFRTFFIDYP